MAHVRYHTMALAKTPRWHVCPHAPMG